MLISVLPYALLAGILPSIVWLFFWLREDIEKPEPRWLIYTAFMGGAVSVVAAIFIERSIGDMVSDQTVRYILWAAAEEICKFAVIAFVALDTRFNDEPIDAMIYLITIALGFSAFENALFALNPLMSGSIIESIAREGTRFIGASLVHTVSSAMIGFSLGFAFYKSRIIKILYASLGLITAIILHSLFNLTIISATPEGTITIFMWVWVAVVILLILFEEIKAVAPKVNTSKIP